MKKPAGWSRRLCNLEVDMHHQVILLALLLVIVTVKVKIIIKKR
jgi:hypothetical protein